MIRKKRSLNNKLIIILWLNLTCLARLNWTYDEPTEMAMFTDDRLEDLKQVYSSPYYSNLLSNSSAVARFSILRTCLSPAAQPNPASLSSTSPFISIIISNLNHTSNSFETSTKYFNCENLFELFCNPSFQLSRYLITHSIFDCEDFFQQAQNSLDLNRIQNSTNFSNNKKDISVLNDLGLKLFSLAASTLQIELGLKVLLEKYQIDYYAIVYSTYKTQTTTTTTDFYTYGVKSSVMYQKFASDLVYKLSTNSNLKLLFSASLNDYRLADLLNNQDVNMTVFLLLRCGEETLFINKYNTQLVKYKINLISIYLTPVCMSLVNFYQQNFTYEFLFKMIPVDYDMVDLSSYTRLLTNIISKNLTNYYNNDSNSSNNIFKISNALNELENYYFMNSFDGISNKVYLAEFNQTINFDCFQNGESRSNDTLTFCRRKLKFYLFSLNSSTNVYDPVGVILFPHVSANQTNAILKLTKELTFQTNYLRSTESTNNSNSDEIFKDALIVIIGLIFFTIFICIVGYVIRSRLMKKELSKGPNKILLLPEDLDFVTATSSLFMSRPNLRENGIANAAKSSLSIRSEEAGENKTVSMAKYKGDMVVVKYLKIPNFQIKNSTMRELRMIRDLRHENLNSFLGCFIDIKAPAVVFEYANRGSLQDIILKKDIKLDWNFKWSMLNDLCRGMRYIHHSAIKCHGNLKSRNCVVDSRWVLKLTDFGLPNIYSNQNFSRTLNLRDLLWTAPELLRQTTIRDQVVISIGSQPGDIYSFSIIMQEIIVRGAPFCMMGLTDEEIINKIKKPPPLLRPSVSKTAAPPEYVNIMRDCWSEQPELRPSFDQLYSMFKSLNGDKKVNIVDLMFKMIEQYTNNLEDLVKEKTSKLDEEKKKTEKLLSEMLPKTVAESLISGESVLPESFDCVTIYFSDIVGFTTISAYSSPIEVVSLLNDLYTMFDEILTDFDVYKVETIGDAYMVVSGLPIRNGNKHAGEIATMALHLLHNCGKFKIGHLPGVPLRLRIGIHSGACVTGVVGLKMPRYCLFGDTVNTASRMESTSTAYRIHVSESSANILNEIGGYHLEFRGITELKGKGMHKTFWLVGKDGFDEDLPDPIISENNHGIDAQLIVQIEKIKADRKEREEKENASKIVELSDEKEEEEVNEKDSDVASLNVSLAKNDRRVSIKDSNNISNANNTNTSEIILNPAQFKSSKLNKNDSGFSEITNGNGIISNSNKTNTAIELNTTNNTNKENKKRLTDVESIA